MKQTAVEWLVEKIQQANPSFQELLLRGVDALITEAKQMEKEQMKIMFEKGIKFMSPPPGTGYMAIKNPKQ